MKPDAHSQLERSQKSSKTAFCELTTRRRVLLAFLCLRALLKTGDYISITLFGHHS